MKYVITILIVGLLGWLVWHFTLGGNSDSATARAEATSSREVSDYLDTIDGTGLSATQRAVLAVLREEYAKNPAGFDETVLTYTEGFEESWCADFIAWVFHAANTPFVHPETGYWRIPGVLTLQEYYQQENAYFEAGEYTPVLGDVAFYFGETPDGSSTEHVAMVLAVEGDTVITIGGNETDAGTLQIRADTLEEGVKGLAGFGASGI